MNGILGAVFPDTCLVFHLAIIKVPRCLDRTSNAGHIAEQTFGAVMIAVARDGNVNVGEWIVISVPTTGGAEMETDCGDGSGHSSDHCHQ